MIVEKEKYIEEAKAVNASDNVIKIIELLSDSACNNLARFWLVENERLRIKHTKRPFGAWLNDVLN